MVPCFITPRGAGRALQELKIWRWLQLQFISICSLEAVGPWLMLFCINSPTTVLRTATCWITWQDEMFHVYLWDMIQGSLTSFRKGTRNTIQPVTFNTGRSDFFAASRQQGDASCRLVTASRDVSQCLAKLLPNPVISTEKCFSACLLMKKNLGKVTMSNF